MDRRIKRKRRRPNKMPEEEIYTKNFKPGIYKCSGCGRRLFSSNAKFDARTAWPSFRQTITNAVNLRLQYGAPIKTVKVLCLGCDKHLGFIFEDGKTCGDAHPEEGKRYSIFSAALNFEENRS